MVESTCFYRSRIADQLSSPPECFSLSATIPQWPQGKGFGTERINLGELEVTKITKFDYIWGWGLLRDEKCGVGFYKPAGVPNGYFSLGHYCQTNNQPLHGFVLVAREAAEISTTVDSPALRKPIDYMLVWSLDDGGEENNTGSGYFWKPQPPEGYKALGYLVTCNSNKPSLEEVSCVRADLTDSCETHRLILDTKSDFLKFPFRVWTMRPSHRGMHGKGVSVGTFFCSSFLTTEDDPCIACLKNSNTTLNAMPNLDQIRALINHYGPTVFFHPEEVYLPSSVSWFFENGALLYKARELTREAIDANGSNLPGAGSNDGRYWIDLPSDDQRERLICGNLESAVLYVHVKPALGGTFTDIVMWVFCPFNGPVTLKLGILNISLGKIGQHVGDWEHFTLRISNFTGELWSVYFSQHSGGEWVDAWDLEYVKGSKCIVYSSKSGHASFPHPGSYLQGSTKLGIGLRNDAAHSSLSVDSSVQYEIVAAEYLGDAVVPEPCWLQFMREWGPTIVYGSRIRLDKVISILPLVLRRCVSSLLNKLPVELYGEEGPTGPKEKNNWVGDERS